MKRTDSEAASGFSLPRVTRSECDRHTEKIQEIREHYIMTDVRDDE